jgi:hypothetical protein
MKLATRSLAFMIAIAATTFSSSQTIPHFDHIVVIVQENRTPDNLFGSGPARTPCNSEDPFEPGVDIENCGPNEVAEGTTYLGSEPLSTCIDPNHTHPAFTNQLDVVMGVPQMDGACINWRGCRPGG